MSLMIFCSILTSIYWINKQENDRQETSNKMHDINLKHDFRVNLLLM